MKPRVPMAAMKRHFESIYSELFGRVRTYSRHFSDRQEAIAEMIAFSWFNLVRKARRTGTLLSASAMAHVAYLRHRSGRVCSGYSVKDVLADQTFRIGRVKVYRLSQFARPHGEHVDPNDEVENSVAAALSTKERDRPDYRAAIRLDWAAFARRLPVRLRNVLRWLCRGERKNWIAKRLGVSPCRVSQLLDTLAQEIRSFFTPELLPVWCTV